MLKRKNRTFYISAAIIFLMAGCHSGPTAKDRLPFYSSADFTPQWVDARAADTVHAIPDFSFTAQDGQQISRSTFNGKITVVDFFFTRCPGICKKLSSHMEKVQQAFRDDDNIRLLSHSVTPDQDSVPVLAKYAKERHAIAGKWYLVTGKRSDIYTLARQSYFADEDLGEQQDSSTFLHTENILLIDKHHHIRGVYKGTIELEIENLVADIKLLEQEE